MSIVQREASSIKNADVSKSGLNQLLASYRSKTAEAVVAPNFEFKEGMLYTQVRAISNRINQNYDAWPSEELKKAYKTFIGKPVFVNHANEDPTLARGRVIAARYLEAGDDHYIEVVQEIDAQRFPKLAREIREGGLDSVSMGVEAGRTFCSYCNKEAVNEPDFCDHVLFHKGEKLTREGANGPEEVLVYESCRDLHFFELSYVFDPADETAVVSKVLVSSKQKRGYGEVEAPQEVDTLRDEEVTGDEDDFHSYVEPPKEFQEPDLEKAKELDRQVGENVAIEPSILEDDEVIDTLDALEEEAHARGLDDGLDSNFGDLEEDETDSVGEEDFEDWDADPLDELYDEAYLEQGVRDEDEEERDELKHLSRRQQSRLNRIAESPTGRRHMADVVDDGFPPGGVGPVSADGIDSFLSDFEEAPVESTEDYPEEGVVDSVVDPIALSDDELLGTLDTLQGEAEVRGLVESDSDSDSESTEETTDDYNDSYEDESASDSEEDWSWDDAEKTSKKNSQRKRSKSMGRSSLADRGRVASRGQLRHHLRKKAEGPLVDDGVQGVNRQSEGNEEEFISQTPPAESVETGGEEISNTENNLVAKLNREKSQMLQTARRLHDIQKRKQGGQKVSKRQKLVTIAQSHPDPKIRKRASEILKGAEKKTSSDRAKLVTIARSHPDPRMRQRAASILRRADEQHPAGGNKTESPVNPPYSGTDAQDTGPDDVFDGVGLDNVETQPKDASRHWFAKFDQWLKQTTGRTASRHQNIGELRRYAQKWSKQTGVPIANLFPAMEQSLRQARAAGKKRANESLDVAAPEGRIDVEAPVANDTDAEAQASQYDKGDFGGNASDNLADPDLSTDHIWPPKEKSSRREFKAAGEILGIQLADAYVKCGFAPEEERYNLMGRFAKMSHPMVSNELKLLQRTASVLEEKNQLIQQLQASRGGSRGARAIPRGLSTSYSQRTAGTERIADNDPTKNDMAMWV